MASTTQPKARRSGVKAPKAKTDTGTKVKVSPEKTELTTGAPLYKQENTRPVIYQMVPRIFANATADCKPNGPITVNGSGKLNDINPQILASIRNLGATHVWYTGVIEHAHDADYTRYGIKRYNPHIIKGRAGSPYAITDYYDIDPDLAVDVPNRLDEFKALVKRTHSEGLGVIIDFVPNHVGREYGSDVRPMGAPADFGTGDDKEMFFSPRNDFYYLTRQQFAPASGVGEGTPDEYVEFPAKASGNDCYTAFPGVNDWYETVKLNYGVDPWNGQKHFDPIPGVWHKMLHILRYWAEMDVDAFRCDMVHMVPVEFWRWVIPQVKAVNPRLKFIAEIYDVGLYDSYLWAGFDYLYDKVTLYDTLRGIQTNHVSAATLTGCWQTLEGKSHNMLTFLENHDEQRYASPHYAGRADTVLPSMAVTAAMGNGAVMIYMGQELGESADDAEGFSGHDGRTTIFDYWSLEKLRRFINGGTADGKLSASEHKLREQYKRLLTAVNRSKALQQGRFFDLMYVNLDNPKFNPHRNYAFLRSTDSETVLVVTNFSPGQAEISVKIPQHAFEIMGIDNGTRRATDLITGKTSEVILTPEGTVDITLKAYDAIMLSMNTKIKK